MTSRIKPKLLHLDARVHDVLFAVDEFFEPSAGAFFTQALACLLELSMDGTFVQSMGGATAANAFEVSTLTLEPEEV